MAPEETVTRDRIDDLINAVFPSFAMLAGMKLGVFTPLEVGPQTHEDLARTLDVDPLKLRALLYALVTTGLVTVDEGRFSNAPVASRFLVQGRPGYLGDSWKIFEDLWRSSLVTAESIRTGRPQAMHDFTSMTPDALRTFFEGLHPNALETGRNLSDRLDLARRRHLLDVGGGSGGVAIAACQACPDLSATVVDLATVTPHTRAFVAEAGMEKRVRVVDGNVVDSLPDGPYDAAVLRAVLQVLPPEAARRVVLNTGRVMAPGGIVCILGRVLDDSRLSPLVTVAHNVMFLNVYDGGQAYTEGEHRAWLTEAGFTDFSLTTRNDGRSVVTAVKAG
jgi:ubiquinone/menaquinone biosynthesis C-methylase UbiE